MLFSSVRILTSSMRRQGAQELLLYLLFGGLAALASLCIGWVLYEEALFPGFPYWCATAAAAAIGLLINFSLNYFFNFKFRERTAFQQFWTFCIVSGLGVALTSFISECLFLLMKYHIGDSIHLVYATLPTKFVANFTAVGLVVIYSFPAHRFISFNVGIGIRFRQLSNRLWLLSGGAMPRKLWQPATDSLKTLI